MAAKKNPAAVALGRLGGLKTGRKGYATLEPEERTAKAREGAKALWAKKRAAAKKGK